MKILISSLLLTGMLCLLRSEPAAQFVVATAHVGGNHGLILARGSYSSSRVWIPGRYEIVEERVWIPGCDERVWVEPVYELRSCAYGAAYRVLVCAGHFEIRRSPGHFELRSARVWRPGYWIARGACR